MLKKLQSRDILEMIEVELDSANVSEWQRKSVLHRVERNLVLFDSMKKPSRINRLIDKYQDSIMFYTILGVVLITAKITIESYIYRGH